MPSELVETWTSNRIKWATFVEIVNRMLQQNFDILHIVVREVNCKMAIEA